MVNMTNNMWDSELQTGVLTHHRDQQPSRVDPRAFRSSGGEERRDCREAASRNHPHRRNHAWRRDDGEKVLREKMETTKDVRVDVRVEIVCGQPSRTCVKPTPPL